MDQPAEVVRPQIVGRQPRVGGELAGQQTLGQRTPVDAGKLVLVTDGQQLRRILQGIQAVLDRRAMLTTGEQLGVGGVVRAPAVRPNLAFGDELLQDLTDRQTLRIGKVADVQLVEVDVVGVEAHQGRVARLACVAGRGVSAGQHPGGLVVGEAELRRDDDLLSLASESPAEDAFAVAGAVRVRGVEERHAEIEREMNGTDRLVVIDLAPGSGRTTKRRGVERAADRPTAKPEWTDLQAGLSKRPELHVAER